MFWMIKLNKRSNDDMNINNRPSLTQTKFSEFYGGSAEQFYGYQKAVCQVILKLLENSRRTGISKPM